VTADFAEQLFEGHRTHLHRVAYRMLGSLSEADDAVQETWLRLSRAAGSGGDRAEVRDLRAWLTTVVSRVCLDMLRSRSARREEPLDTRVPDPIVTRADSAASWAADDPQEHAVLAESVGLALLVVLDTLSPAERLAFVLHDVFALPFEEIGPILDRSPAAAKQLASRARRRLRGASSRHPDLARQRRVAAAFLAAAQGGDFEGLLTILDPEVTLRADAGTGPLGPSAVTRGAADVIAQAARYAALGRFARPVLVNGAPGFLVAPPGAQPVAVLALTIVGDRITELNILADPDRLACLDLSDLLH
jgi:RNA polymerase sigma factor (sigma-70 family)